MATKKISAKNSRAKRLENIEWLIKVTIRQKINKEAFDKSYFGSEYINKTTTMAKTNFTPDRQITPDDDLRTKDCIECNGTGEVIEWNEDDVPEPTRCPVKDCVNGQVPIDESDLEDDW